MSLRHAWRYHILAAIRRLARRSIAVSPFAHVTSRVLLSLALAATFIVHASLPAVVAHGDDISSAGIPVTGIHGPEWDRPESGQFKTGTDTTHPHDKPPDEIIVKFRERTRASSDDIHRSMGAGAVSYRRSGRFDVVRVPDGTTIEDFIDAYINSGAVEYAEPNYRRTALWEPNDPQYEYQWNLDQVNAETAWDIEQGGSSDIVVAVLDTGVAYEDYEDDDEYFLAPDLAGTTFTDGYDSINDDSHANDDNGHGTHVCGTIAQTTDNDTGVAGLAFGVSIMPVKVLDEEGRGTVAALVDGIEHAVDNGADIINLSLGGEGYSEAEEEAVDYAYANGVVVIASAGNEYDDGNEPPQYPAAFDTTIAVGATRYDMTRAPYSNTGDYIDLVAPGGHIPDPDNVVYTDGILQQTFSSSYDDFGYYYGEGTSMACPHVAAAAALLLSCNPGLTPDEIRTLLESTAHDLGPEGQDEEYGHGLLDAAAALTMAGSAPTVETGTASAIDEESAVLHGTLVEDFGQECQYSFQYGTDQGGPYQETDWTGNLSEGDSFQETVTDLDSGTTYYYRTCARNSAGTGCGEERAFTTVPEPPTTLEAVVAPEIPFYRMQLSWSQENASARTHIRAQEGGYPVDRTDGELVYDGSDTSCLHSGLSPETKYYYSAWSYVSDVEGTDIWSNSVDQTGTTDPAPEEVPMTIPLEQGWNMVSVPLLLSNPSPDHVFPDIEAIYSWDPLDKSYYEPADIEPYRGYWVAVANPDGISVDVTGVPMEAWDAPLHRGWNMMGSVYSDEPVSIEDHLTTDVEPDPVERNAIYRWDPASRSYQSVDEITSAAGYWVASTDDCTAYLS
ncbi:MAG: S8 family peptidase [Chloroflexota bacterium]